MPPRLTFLPLASLGLFVGAVTIAAAPAAPTPPRVPPSPSAVAGSADFFERKIRPLLSEKCFTCHGPSLQEGKLRLDSAEALTKGGAHGPALLPGRPDESLLVRAVRYTDPNLRMPPETRLRDDQIADLQAWVRAGARWPSERRKDEGGRIKSSDPSHPSSFRLPPSGEHWAFLPPRRPAVPAVKLRGWVKTPIDAFLLAEMEKQGLRPALPADRRTLLRRACFDLTGLPPTPEQIERFVTDRSPHAWEKVVDALLASPAYGERWGRHWLDVVRYADSNGLDENYHYANAWRYRDYVVDAFNRDLPYDQFVREQIAGDLLPQTGDPAVDHRRLTATGWMVFGPKLIANPDKQQVLLDIIDEQVDVTSKAFMGLTLSCARCHDHKFDPLPQKDYYGLAGIFKSTRTMVSLKDRKWMERPLVAPEVAARFEEHAKLLEARKKSLESARKKAPSSEKTRRLEEEVAELERSAPPPVPYVMAVEDAGSEDLPLYVRGNPHAPGEMVPRHFPVVLTSHAPPAISKSGSGRLELAQWLTRPDHPLTARVMVNRVWQWHFGRGLVGTPDNFGKLGEAPTHPALLDWLASEFASAALSAINGSTGHRVNAHSGAWTHLPIASLTSGTAGLGWSLKRLHRLIMLSSAYQMSSSSGQWSVVSGQKAGAGHRVTGGRGAAAPSHSHSAIRNPQSEDPENHFLSRMNRRHLEVEELRDALLATSGQLDRAMGGSLLHVPNFERVTNDQSGDLAAGSYASNRRSLYLPVIRNSLFEFFELFDPADASSVTGRRSETIAAPQALFLMNHPLVWDCARHLAARVQSTATDDAGRVRTAYLLVFGRAPQPQEAERALAFLKDYAATAGGDPVAARRQAWESFSHALYCSNEFAYVD